MSLVFPDYENSILNLASSVFRAYDIETPHPTLTLLDSYLVRRHRNRVFLILDGMGVDFLEHALPPESFLRQHIVHTITSVYPSTTAAAITTYQTGMSPLEHGWLGWSLFFKEFGRSVDVFLDRDTMTGIEIKPSPAQTFLPFNDKTCEVRQAGGIPAQCRRILPPFAEAGVSSMSQLVAKIREYCLNGENQLIAAYWYEPDSLMHRDGPYCEKAVQEIQAYDAMLTELATELKDTLFIISADHGQVEIERDIIINDIPALDECLIMPPSIEGRAASLFVKPARLRDFRQTFSILLGEEFLLMSRAEAFDRGLFGPGKAHPKVDDFVGDFVACGIGKSILRYRTCFERPMTLFKGHHAGLLKEEMLVPLIIVET
ncbi:MAG: alkaline phosphatase family protein [Saccharofermentanales bacterium]|jgi:hypothetical protein